MRRLFHDPSAKQITFCDERFYKTADGNFYPSVTTVLDLYPKGREFNEWLKHNGQEADIIVNSAADTGSKVHEAIDKLQQGDEVLWDDSVYTLREWQMINRFIDFFKHFQPEIISSEFTLVCDKYAVAGTVDMVCRLLGKLWLIDLKTSNYVHATHHIQAATYTTMFNEINKGEFPPIQKTGILHLNAKTRTEGGKGKIQGAGWQLVPVTNCQKHFASFRHVRAIWDLENPNPRPKNLVYPDRLKLSDYGNLATATV